MEVSEMTLRHAVLALALAGVAATAQAGVKASAMNPTNWTTFTRGPLLVPLNAAGATTLSFSLASAGKKLLTFSSECAVNGLAGKYGDYLDLDIVVNGVVVVPTVDADPFCSTNGTGGFDSYFRSSITIPVQLKSGTNTVQIRASGSANVTGMWLGQSALVIYD
jgi:hypothetical protein